MRDQLLAYLLDDLDPDQRDRVEERIASDPIWQHELERLRACVEQTCGSDGDDAPNHNAPNDELPNDLVQRTCCFVEEASSRGELAPATLPAKLSESWDEAPATSRRWSLLDLAVAGCILVVLGSLLMPALRGSRDTARIQQCALNLKNVGRVLISYMDRHKGQLPAIGRHENAGMFAVKLADSGLVTPEQLAEWLLCPASPLAEKVFRGKIVMRVPTQAELATASDRQLRLWREIMAGDFAVRIGFTDQTGKYHQAQFKLRTNEPLLGDKPNLQLVGAQSDNHGSCGQNVFFLDQSVRYVTLCMQSGPDRNWYLNQKNRHAAGIGPSDIVLIRSEVTPSGVFTSH